MCFPCSHICRYLLGQESFLNRCHSGPEVPALVVALRFNTACLLKTACVNAQHWETLGRAAYSISTEEMVRYSDTSEPSDKY